MIDCHTAIGHWPFQRLEPRTARELSNHLAQRGIHTALTVSLEAVLLRDTLHDNRRLAEACEPFASLLPVPTLHPGLGGSVTELEALAPAAVRLLPNYHGYSLLDPLVQPLLRYLESRGLPLLVPLRLEDERSHHPVCPVPPVPAGEVAAMARDYPGLAVICSCAKLAEAVEVTQSGANILTDFAFIDSPNALATVIRKIPARQIVFGSHTPVLVTESNLMKMQYAEAGKTEWELIAEGNARRILQCKTRTEIVESGP